MKKRATHPKASCTKCTKRYPSITIRTTKHQECGLRHLKLKHHKPLAYFIAQGVVMVLRKYGVKTAGSISKTTSK